MPRKTTRRRWFLTSKTLKTLHIHLHHLISDWKVEVETVMKLSTILLFACLLVGVAPLNAQKDRELGGFLSNLFGGGGGYGGWNRGYGGYRDDEDSEEDSYGDRQSGGYGGGYGGYRDDEDSDGDRYGDREGDRERNQYDGELVSITCSAEFECACNGRNAVFVCREKSCNDGSTKLKPKCIDPSRARPTDVCGCCGQECPRRNKHNSFENWDKDYYSEDDEDEDSDEDQSEYYGGYGDYGSYPDPSPPNPRPSPRPTPAPVASPTVAPVADPSPAPSRLTGVPTNKPSASPTDSPVTSPTRPPSEAPVPSPSAAPTGSPSSSPTRTPTDAVTVLVTQNDSDEPLPPNVVTITEYLGAAVTFTITQKWKTSGSISWIALAYDQAAGDMFCNEDDKEERVAYNEVNTYTALCDGDTATIDLFVHDGTFSGSQTNIRNCNGWGNDDNIAYYSITLSCDGSTVVQTTTTTATLDSELPVPLEISEELQQQLPTASPTLRSAAFEDSSIAKAAGVDEEIKMRRIYLGAGAGAVVLLLVGVIVKLWCFRKPKAKPVG